MTMVDGFVLKRVFGIYHIPYNTKHDPVDKNFGPTKVRCYKVNV